LTKDGKRFEFEMLYDSKQAEPYLTVYQEDLKKVGITMNLRLVTFETAFKLTYGRQFDMTEAKWGAPNFPDPDTMFHSRLADVNDNDNITGFKDPKIDQILEKYGRTFDLKERTALIKELDGILTGQYHYALAWYPPAERLAFWNKFGYPEGYLTRTGEYESGLYLGPGMEMLWWIDPAKEQALQQAMADPSKKLEAGEVESHFWQKQGVSN
jgi:microcin C transport system substrate-binding protein